MNFKIRFPAMKVQDNQIEKELSGHYKPLTIESGITTFPFSELSDREFELMSYLLAKEKIENNSFGKHTDIALMQGVAERGRDCVLYKEGKVSGLIQCKKYQGRLTKPQFLKELIKFSLFAVKDSQILPDRQSFEYYLFVSYDVTEPTLTLIKSFKEEIAKEISSNIINKYIREVVNEYESFSSYLSTPPIFEITNILCSIDVKYQNSTDLSRELNANLTLAKTFFSIMSVIDIEGVDKVMRKTLDDYGLRLITDIDLKALQDRIGEVNESDRVNLGLADFYGYSTEFFKFIQRDELKKLLESVANVTTTLNRLELDFLNSKIHEYTLQKITYPLLFSKKIHPFSVGIAAPYLFQKLSLKLISKSMPEGLIPKLYPHSELNNDELIGSISEQLFESSSRIMNKDYSQLVGEPNIIEFKISIYENMHRGFRNINDARDVFKHDIQILKPILDEIEKEISDLISETKTIVIKDGSFLDNDTDILRFKKTIDKIE